MRRAFSGRLAMDGWKQEAERNSVCSQTLIAVLCNIYTNTHFIYIDKQDYRKIIFWVFLSTSPAALKGFSSSCRSKLIYSLEQKTKQKSTCLAESTSCFLLKRLIGWWQGKTNKSCQQFVLWISSLLKPSNVWLKFKSLFTINPAWLLWSLFIFISFHA